MNIKLTTLKCKRCGHMWVPKKTRVTYCPGCKTALFDIPKPTPKPQVV